MIGRLTELELSEAVRDIVICSRLCNAIIKEVREVIPEIRNEKLRNKLIKILKKR